MADQYLLPCDCGLRVGVNAGQAGATVRCACGRMLDVPTMRGLARFPREEDAAGAHGGASWGLRQRLICLGLIIAAVGSGTGVYLLVTRPAFPQERIDDFTEQRIEAIRDAAPRWTPEQTLRVWRYIQRNGLQEVEHPIARRYRESVAPRDYVTLIALAIAGLGLLLAGGVTFFYRPR